MEDREDYWTVGQSASHDTSVIAPYYLRAPAHHQELGRLLLQIANLFDGPRRNWRPIVLSLLDVVLINSSECFWSGIPKLVRGVKPERGCCLLEPEHDEAWRRDRGRGVMLRNE